MFRDRCTFSRAAQNVSSSLYKVLITRVMCKGLFKLDGGAWGSMTKRVILLFIYFYLFLENERRKEVAQSIIYLLYVLSRFHRHTATSPCVSLSSLKGP